MVLGEIDDIDITGHVGTDSHELVVIRLTLAVFAEKLINIHVLNVVDSGSDECFLQIWLEFSGGDGQLSQAVFVSLFATYGAVKEHDKILSLVSPGIQLF